MTMESPIRLNLGAGNAPMPGYVNLDIKDGVTIDALPYDDGTIDEIRASHVLEHVSHRKTLEVLRHWHAKLKPGGTVKIAVPDIEWCIAQMSQPRCDPNIEAYIMGAHEDEHDRHGAIFTENKLGAMLHASGFDCISKFASDHLDCSSLPVSLNMQAYKPTVGDLSDVVCLMSMPRVSFTANMLGVMAAIIDMRMSIITSTGAFWGQCLTRIMEQAIREHPSARWLLTVDYDTVFVPDQVRTLRRLADRHKADAIFPVQVKRDEEHTLIGIFGEDGKPRKSLPFSDTRTEVIDCDSGHFGLTLLNVEALGRIEKPWFQSSPDERGGWDDGHTDDDMWFWRQWRKAGNTLKQANLVKIGHIQQVITWPTPEWKARHQFVNDYTRYGIPDWAR